ncbi:MAG: hypothetical protein C4K58_04765 [Flavobacteriaceae bacterium]|nr:MAG: hypothetical protein C4K58_04765 [Flavobacteriaceae bacterium]
MKQLLLLAFSLLTILSCHKDDDVPTTTTKKVYNGNVSLNTQEKVVEFGKNGYEEINGTLYLSEAVTSLTPLSSITKVGTLNIRYTNLINLDGLNINSVQNIEIDTNPKLTEIKALKNITNLSSLTIITNTDLKELTGLDYLISADNISISGNDELISLNALNGLKYVNETFSISLNEKLISVNLKSLYKVKNFKLQANRILNEVSAYLKYVEDLTIVSNPKLSDFCDLSIYDNQLLKTETTKIGLNLYNPTLDQLKRGICQP